MIQRIPQKHQRLPLKVVSCESVVEALVTIMAAYAAQRTNSFGYVRIWLFPSSALSPFDVIKARTSTKQVPVHTMQSPRVTF